MTELHYPDTAKTIILDLLDAGWSFKTTWTVYDSPRYPRLYIEGTNNFDDIRVTYSNSGNGYRFQYGIVNGKGKRGFKEVREFIRHNSMTKTRNAHLHKSDLFYVDVPLV